MPRRAIGGGMEAVIISSGQCFQYLSDNRHPSSRTGWEDNTPWQRPQSIRPVSIIIRQPLITTRPPTIIIKPPIIMTSASTKRRRSTPKRLTNIASRDASTPRPPTNIPINDGHKRRRRCRLLLLVLTRLEKRQVKPTREDYHDEKNVACERCNDGRGLSRRPRKCSGRSADGTNRQGRCANGGGRLSGFQGHRQ